jgi:HAD superfamily hydrolase (TIGR01490 family)
MDAKDAAFFDVDETLISIKSMFRFLEFYLARRGEKPETYARLRAESHAMAAAGRPREEVNRAYYRCYAGESVAELTRVGVEWAAQEARRPGLLLEAAGELAEFTAAGTPSVLLSGSFFACLDPIATLLGAGEAHGAPVVVRRGVLTGAVTEPMIGQAKQRKLRQICAERGHAPARCVAYGDHPSDLPMLTAVGDAVVVGDHPAMRAAARARGWRLLRGVPTPV